MTRPDLADFAAREFRRRQGIARDAARRDPARRGELEAMLRPWLAIAAAAGADLPELAEPVTVIVGTAASTRRRHSSDIAEPSAWQTELLRARDVAIAKCEANRPAHAELVEAALSLSNLARHLGLPEWQPGPVQQLESAA